MTLGSAAAAQVRLIVWCKACQHQVEPDPAEMATRYGAETSVLDWRDRLVCFKCGSRQIDMVGRDRDQTVSGADGSRWPILLRRGIGAQQQVATVPASRVSPLMRSENG
jgi:hypothetical protein